MKKNTKIYQYGKNRQAFICKYVQLKTTFTFTLRLNVCARHKNAIHLHTPGG